VRILIILATLLLHSAYAAPVLFSATGVFQNGAVLSGVLTIDTATGSAVGADLAVSGIAAHFTTFVLQRTWPPSSPFLSETIFKNSQSTNNELIFLFPPVSLIGYTGGVLCGLNPAVCQDQTLTYLSNFNTQDSNGFSTNFVDLNYGPLQATPEPSTWAMCLIGLAPAMLTIRTRRFF
jgi:hypothetical protein